MRNLFSALAALVVLSLASSVSAADCLCDWSNSLESCVESAEANEANEEPRRAPMWCERSDDPRCMPAGTHGGVFQNLVPLANVWFQPVHWTPPPRPFSLVAIRVDGGSKKAHARKIERPPR